jgi:NhaP-type Na+/H+ or K+/H+ antiporter
MYLNSVIVVAGLFLVYSLISRALENTSITAPMIFTGFGLLISVFWAGLLGDGMEHGAVHTLAEVTLIFVLFSDASRIDVALLRRDHNLPQRMLLIGMPLTILFGTLAALLMFREFYIWEAALLAAILTPTDAALGQAVVSNKLVPVRIRQAINVESGLNDGIALPLVLIFASLASLMAAGESAGFWIGFSFLQLALGPLTGIIIGFVGAKLVDFSVDRNWISGSFEGIGALCVAVIAFTGAEIVHGNGFIAAFIAGLVFGNFLKHQCKFLYEFAESEGQFFTLTTFLIFGGIAIHLIGESFHWTYIVYAALSLTVIRMIPVAFSLIGSGVNGLTTLFLGWFGPRGLASILFGLLIIEKTEIPHREQIISVVVITVLMSILVHGLTAAPASRKYGESIEKIGECEETNPVSEMPV